MPGYGRGGAWNHGQSPWGVPGAKPGRFPYPIVQDRVAAPENYVQVITEQERNVYIADFESVDTSGNGFIEDDEAPVLPPLIVADPLPV